MTPVKAIQFRSLQGGPFRIPFRAFELLSFCTSKPRTVITIFKVKIDGKKMPIKGSLGV